VPGRQHREQLSLPVTLTNHALQCSFTIALALAVRMNEPSLLRCLNPFFLTEDGVFPMASNPPIQAQAQSQMSPRQARHLNPTNMAATTAGARLSPCLQPGIETDRLLPLRRELLPWMRACST